MRQRLQPWASPSSRGILYQKLPFCSSSICPVEPVSNVPWGCSPSKSQRPQFDESSVPEAQEQAARGDGTETCCGDDLSCSEDPPLGSCPASGGGRAEARAQGPCAERVCCLWKVAAS